MNALKIAHPRWPHQEKAIRESRRLYSHCQSWVITAPTGAGKSRIMQDLAFPAVQNGKRVLFLVHRRLLLRQVVEQFQSYDMQFGVTASGWSYLENEEPLQIASMQTLASRVGKGFFTLPPADLLIVDEAHAQTHESATKIIDEYKCRGSKIIGITATPVDCGGIYEELLIAGNSTDMLKCKAHLPTLSYSGAVADESLYEPVLVGSDRANNKKVKVKAIFGNVLSMMQKLNPEGRPTMLFAPGVKESIWFVNELAKHGISACHIDAENIVRTEMTLGSGLKVREYERNEKLVQEMFDGSRLGHYQVICNRFVLREAIDMPWIYHVITACAFGGVSTYLQAVGRAMRFWPQWDEIILQDHGGNVFRHGMPDEDRDWVLGDSDRSIAKAEKKKREKEKGEEIEPICCPKCQAMRTHGSQCPKCGHKHKMSVRLVYQHDGELKRVKGRIVKHKKPIDFPKIWKGALFSSANSGRSYAQAVASAEYRAEKKGVAIDWSAVPEPQRPSSVKNRKLTVGEIFPWTIRKNSR